MIRHLKVILSLLILASVGSAKAAPTCASVFHLKRSQIIEISVDDLKRSKTFLDNIDRSRTVGVYGSARLAEDHPAYKEAYRFAQLLALSKKITVTGGGLSIMKAANSGAKSKGGESYGVIIHLPHEVTKNPYLDDAVSHRELYTRMEVLVRTAGAGHAFFYGGIGTLQELTHVLSLMQNRQMAKAPIVLVGSSYWAPFKSLLEDSLLREGTISKDDMELFRIVDTAEQAYQVIFPDQPVPQLAP